MPDSTSLPAAVVADTIVRTVELGVTITDAAVDAFARDFAAWAADDAPAPTAANASA